MNNEHNDSDHDEPQAFEINEGDPNYINQNSENQTESETNKPEAFRVDTENSNQTLMVHIEVKRPTKKFQLKWLKNQLAKNLKLRILKLRKSLILDRFYGVGDGN